jgi:hypothetical protein
VSDSTVVVEAVDGGVMGCDGGVGAGGRGGVDADDDVEVDVGLAT